MPTVLVVDDHDAMRESIVAVLEFYEQMQVVAQAQDAETALAAARRHRPKVVVLDVLINSADRGADVCASLKRMLPEVVVIAHTSYGPDQPEVGSMFEAGADAYVDKSQGANALARRILELTPDTPDSEQEG